jgi:hypothetical protein
MRIFLPSLIRFHCPFVKAFMALGFLFSDLLSKGHAWLNVHLNVAKVAITLKQQ